MYYFFLILLFVTPFLVLGTYLMTTEKQSTLMIAVCHALAMLTNIVLVLNCPAPMCGLKEDAPDRWTLAGAFVGAHLVMGGLHAWYLWMKQGKTSSTPR